MNHQHRVDRIVEVLDEQLVESGIEAEFIYEPCKGTKFFKLFVVSKSFSKSSHFERQELLYRFAKRADHDDFFHCIGIYPLTPQEYDEWDLREAWELLGCVR